MSLNANQQNDALVSQSESISIYGEFLKADPCIPFTERQFLTIARYIMAQGLRQYEKPLLENWRVIQLGQMASNGQAKSESDLYQFVRVIRTMLRLLNISNGIMSVPYSTVKMISEWLYWYQIGSHWAFPVGEKPSRVYAASIRPDAHWWLNHHLLNRSEFLDFAPNAEIESIFISLPMFPVGSYVQIAIRNSSRGESPTVTVTECIDNQFIVTSIAANSWRHIPLSTGLLRLRPANPESCFDDSDAPSEPEMRQILSTLFQFKWCDLTASIHFPATYLAQHVFPWMEESHVPRPKDLALLDLLQLGCQQPVAGISDERRESIMDWLQEKIGATL